jgi:hypothetical protein
MNYNTQREKLAIPEYGRGVHEMIAYAITIEDREKRNRAARQIVMVMGQLTNAQREGGDYKQKLWDHLFIISDYKLDVDSPFPRPEAKAERLPVKPHYPHQQIRFMQYGKNIEMMIEKTIEYPDGEEKETLTRYIANHLKKMYLNWNRESVQDDLIGKHLTMLSDGKLELSEDTRLEATTEIIHRNKKKKFNGGGGKQNNKNYGNYNRKKQRKQQG